MNQKLISFLFTSSFLLFFANGFSQSLYGFLNQKGEEVIPAKFEAIGDFSEGLAPAQLNGKWGYINKNGNFVIKAKFGFAENFKNGYAKVGNSQSSNQFNYIDTDGKLVDPDNILTEPFYFEGLRIVKVGEKFGFKDVTGKIVIQPIYDMVENFNGSGLAIVKQEDKYGIINKKQQVIYPISQPYIYNFKGGYFGIYNKANECFIYDSTGNFKKIEGAETISISMNDNGLFFYTNQNNQGFLNKKGEVVIPAIYDWATSENGNIVAVKQGSLVNIFSVNNPPKIIASFTPPNQEFQYFFKNGLAKFAAIDKGNEGFIDFYGQVLIPTKYKYLNYMGFQEGLVGFQKADPVNAHVSDKAVFNSPTTSAVNNTQAQSSTTTTSGNISSSSYDLDMFSELGSMALYVGNNMYVVKIKGKTMGDQSTVAARAAQVAGVRGNYKYQWFAGKNCVTLKSQYSSVFTIYCNGEIDLSK